MTKRMKIIISKCIFFFIMPLFISFYILIIFTDYSHQINNNVLSVYNGIIDFSNIKYNDIKNTRLNGQWEFYPEKLLTHDDFMNEFISINYINVPSNWNNYILNGDKMCGIGYGTYRLNIKLPESQYTYALKLPEIYTAFNIFIDGQLYMKSGIVSNKQVSSAPGSTPSIVHFSNNSEKVEIIIQVSNYNHKYGGIKLPIYFGTSNNIERYGELLRNFDIIIATILLVMSIIFIIEYFIDDKNKRILYFSIVCISLFFRMIYKGEAILYTIFGNNIWNILIKGEYINLTILVLYITKFYIEIYEEKTKDMIIIEKIINIIGIFLIVLAIILPPIYMSQLIYIYIGYSVFMLYIVYLSLCSRKLKQDNIPLLVVQPIMSIGIILEGGGYFLNIPIVSYFTVSAVILCCVNSVLVLKRIAKEFKKNQIINKNLESLIMEKSYELEMANKKLTEINMELEVQATTDSLTKIYNRRKFEFLIEREAKYYSDNKKLSLIMFDIDFFKKVNDTFGHEAGDEVLKEMVMVVKGIIRSLDIFARWGGEEFMILLPNVTLSDSIIMAEKIRKTIENHIFNMVGSITVSFGVAQLDEKGIKNLIKLADQRLYEAKRTGRNKVVGN